MRRPSRYRSSSGMMRVWMALGIEGFAGLGYAPAGCECDDAAHLGC